MIEQMTQKALGKKTTTTMPKLYPNFFGPIATNKDFLGLIM